VGVDILFAPSDREMYPEGPDAQTIWVDPGDLATHLCGASRPGHFRGVATVVAKLLGMVQPDLAYFGQKDGQQAIIVTRLVRDLGMPVQIRVVPTARESDGLALSSRNVYLSAQEREQAVALWQALTVARTMITGGERDAERMEEAMREHIRTAAPLARLDYATVADVERLQPIGGLLDRDAIIAVAAYFGSTRLIDNMLVHFRDGRPQLR
jgi:pantoate--beta-alanine ligase